MSSSNPSSPPPPVLLHGDLHLTIHEARRLPNMDMLTERLRRLFAPCGALVPHRPAPDPDPHRPHPGPPHRPHSKIITSDPYVTARLSSATLARTRVISNSENPVWDETFAVPLAHTDSHLRFHVKDDDIFGAQLIGTVSVPAAQILESPIHRIWFPILASNGKPPKPESALLVSIRFVPMSETGEHRHGLAGDPERRGVRGTYFPVRRGGTVTLYQDAHVNEGDLVGIGLDDGRVFEQGRCWEDICHSILEAHHMIYVVGWSIYCKVKLVRESTRRLPSGGELTLGELLKYKSQEGVRVCLLVWDDKTSHDK